MPTRAVSANAMSPGGKAGGKHWTKCEVESRQKAQGGMRRRRVTLRAPSWLTAEAKVVWKHVRKRLAGIELLDNLDTEMLAVYCDAYVKYREASRAVGKSTDAGSAPTPDDVKALQAWARIMATYADKLGLTPGGRARLAKRKAEKVADEFGDRFDS